MNGKNYEDILRLLDIEPTSKLYEAMQMVHLKTMNEIYKVKEEKEKQAVTLEPCKAEQFIDIFNQVSAKIADIAISRGFYKFTRNDGQDVALMHSELSDALEYMRHGNPKSDNIPEFTGVEENLADVIVRVMSYAFKYRYRVGEALIEKMKFNSSRANVAAEGKFF